MTKQIYFYSDPARYEDQIALGRTPMLKIGDTEQETTDQRIKQQDTTSCAQLLENKGSYFTPFGDKEFHKHLQKLGYEKTREEREWFYITVEDAERELIDYKNGVVKVKKYFSPRPHQAWVNQEILNRFDGSYTVIQPLNLCARFGKTLQALSLFKESNLEVMVVAGFWLAANESFINTVNERFDIASDIAVIKPDYDEFKQAIDKGQRVLIDLSLHTEVDKVDQRLLGALNVYKKLIYIDEADFGAWTSSSRDTANLFIESGINLVCVATGTNIDRALIGSKGHIEPPITVSYLDLIEAKRGEGYLFQPDGFCSDNPQEWMDTLKDVVDVACLNLDIGKELVDELEQLDETKLPNMSKIFSKRNTHIQREIIKSLLVDNDFGSDVFGLYSTEYGSIEHPAVMMFIPGTKADVNNLVKVGKTIEPNYNWIALHGDEYTNRTAEKVVKDAIKSGKEKTVIISCGMGSRSFSVPNIVAVINCKDGGSIGSAVQQASRCFTPGCGKEVGLVVNYSFNTHKTSSFETDLISSAIQYDANDTDAAVRRVYGLMNFFKGRDEEGYMIRLSENDFLSYITSKDNLENMASATIDMKSLLSDISLLDILDGIEAKPTTDKEWKGIISKAKTYIQQEKKEKGEPDPEKKTVRDLIRKIQRIIQTTGNTYYLAPNDKTFKECLQTISKNEDKDLEYQQLVGVSSQTVLDCVYEYLPESFMNLIINRVEKLDTNDNFDFVICDHMSSAFDFSNL